MMKKLIDRAFAYALTALAAGVFYREFTKWHGFEGKTTLSVLHPHLLVLGSLLLLIVALFAARIPLQDSRHHRRFLALHTLGLVGTALTMATRGVLQVLQTPLSRGADAALSGVAGLFHIVLGIALTLLFLGLRQAAAGAQKQP